MPKFLVFGKNGQVAAELAKQVANTRESSSWIFLSSADVNFENSNAIIEVLGKYQPHVVVNCAAYTAVDLAETEQDKARQINAIAPGIIAKWCFEHGASLIHFSTDYVYPGTGEQPWKEDSELAPVNFYGLSKLEGEHKIQTSRCHYYVFRTSWVYSVTGTNFVKTMLRLGSDREQLKIVADQVGSPTSARDLARAMIKVLEHPKFKEFQGVFNLAGNGFVSWFDFANEIFREARGTAGSSGRTLKIREVLPIMTSEYTTPAQRPLNSRLDQNKFLRAFGIEIPHWRTGLSEALAELWVGEITK